MQKSSFLSLNNDRVILHKPLHENTDFTSVKHEVKRVLLEIREAYGKPIRLGFSGGTDSLFLLHCYKDLMEEGKLYKKDLIITVIKYSYKDFIKNVEDPLFQFRLNRYKNDIDEILTYEINMRQVGQYIKTYPFKISISNTLLQVARKELADHWIIINHIPIPTLYFMGGIYDVLHEDGIAIDVFTWDVNVWCSLIDKNLASNDFITYSQLNNANIPVAEIWYKYLHYCECYPDCRYGYPKYDEKDLQMAKKLVYNAAITATSSIATSAAAAAAASVPATASAAASSAAFAATNSKIKNLFPTEKTKYYLYSKDGKLITTVKDSLNV